MNEVIEPGRMGVSVRDPFVILASLVVILAGARYAASLLEPLFLALFLAIICGSPIRQGYRVGY